MGETIGLIGYGRFGRALDALFADVGHLPLAFDPHVAPPPERAAGSLEELVARAAVLVIATPIGEISATTKALAPLVRPEQLALDVSSVKLQPLAELRAAFEGRCAWAATHPLFGPTSIALGERPLRVVICRDGGDAAARSRARALFEGAGCLVVERDADEHDRVMAESHALAYFIAKALMQAGLDPSDEIAPPSAQAIARTVDAARADAGHLLVALHRDNPHAASVRRRFLGALGEIDLSLESLSEEQGADAGAASDSERALALPDLGARSPEIREVRELIDDIDRDIVALLARRTRLALRVAEAKAGIGHGVRDPRRERSLAEARRSWARDAELEPLAVEAVFREIVRLSREAQASLAKSKPSASKPAESEGGEKRK